MTSKCGRVLAVSVHDLRTPLAVVAGYLGLLLRQQADPFSERQRQILTSMEKAADTLTRLVGEMSDLSNLETHSSALARRKVNLAALVKHASNAVVQGGSGTITLHGTLPDASLMGDRQRLQTAFNTIFSTALRETLPGQTIVVGQMVRRARTRRQALIAAGEEKNVDRLLNASPRRLAPFDSSGGARTLAGVLACRVMAAHGGDVWMLRGSHDGPGMMVQLPLKAS